MHSKPTLDMHVVPGDDLPIYRQIVRQIGDAVASGHLVPGDRLPSQRELAQQLVVAPLTVKKAYDLLEAEGLVESRHGSGTFVAQGAGRDEARARDRLDQTARQLATQAWHAGLGEAELLDLVRDAAERLERERTQRTATSAADRSKTGEDTTTPGDRGIDTTDKETKP